MKFNLNFDNIIKSENLRGNYEIQYAKYLQRKRMEYSDEDTVDIEYEKERDLEITKDNNRVRNKKRYRTIVDNFEILGFNCRYIINIYSIKDRENVMYSVWKYPLKDDGEEIYCGNIMVKTFHDKKDNKIIVFVKDKEFLDSTSELILKDSMDRVYVFKVADYSQISTEESYCKLKDKKINGVCITLDAVILESANDIYNAEMFVEMFVELNTESYNNVTFFYKNEYEIENPAFSITQYGLRYIFEFKDLKTEIKGNITHVYVNANGLHFDDFYLRNILGKEYIIHKSNTQSNNFTIIK